MTAPVLSIGEVASRAGINVSAIRFYERKGLLPQPDRSGGQRRYGEEILRRLAVIDAAKRAGFSLEEVGALLTATDRGTRADEQLRALAARKLPEVEALIERVQLMRDWLLVASECSCETLEVCALFDGQSAAERETSVSS